MKEREILILVMDKDETYVDLTKAIETMELREDFYYVKFHHSDKNFRYHQNRVIIRNNGQKIKTTGNIVYICGIAMNAQDELYRFDEFVKQIMIVQNEEKSDWYKYRELRFVKTCNEEVLHLYNYFEYLSSYLISQDDNAKVVFEQFHRISDISCESILSCYWQQQPLTMQKPDGRCVFPFSSNSDQQAATETAFVNRCSIIEGAAGTGKTQTVLNIAINAIMRNQSVAVVSSNNAVLTGIASQLDKKQYGFLAALLGDKRKRDDYFFKRQVIPKLWSWKEDAQSLQQKRKLLSVKQAQCQKLQEQRRKLAELDMKIMQDTNEFAHFRHDMRVSKQSFEECHKVFGRQLTASKVLEFMAEYEWAEKHDTLDTAGTKLHFLSKYGVKKSKVLQKQYPLYMLFLHNMYYEKHLEDLRKEKEQLENWLANQQLEVLEEDCAVISQEIFEAYLHTRYVNQEMPAFSEEEYLSRFMDFQFWHPLVLSTTHSLLSSIPKNHVFDYIVIDDSANMDLVSAALVMNAARNLVIVRDSYYQPAVLGMEVHRRNSAYIQEHEILEMYHYARHTLTSSLVELYGPQLPITTLRNNYRCDPQILAFVNQKYYHNQLYAMRLHDAARPAVWMLIGKPNSGKYDKQEDEWYNIWQAEIIQSDILEKTNEMFEEIGVVSPYQKQIRYLRQSLTMGMGRRLEIEAVQRFQGREKNTMILSTAVNEPAAFMAKEDVVCQVLTRARKECILVCSDADVYPHGNQLGDLMRYIHYQSINEKFISVPKHLLEDYEEVRVQYRKKMRSTIEFEVESEMKALLMDVMRKADFYCFDLAVHVPVQYLVQSNAELTREEWKYIQNTNNFLDFVIYNRFDKEPIFAIELGNVLLNDNERKQAEAKEQMEKIFKKQKFPYLRFYSTGNGEDAVVIKQLHTLIDRSLML